MHLRRTRPSGSITRRRMSSQERGARGSERTTGRLVGADIAGPSYRSKARRGWLGVATEQLAALGEFTPVVRRLACLRGASTLTRFTLAVEIGDWHRFTGKRLGSFVGLMPTEYSSGGSRHGSINKTGNSHMRRLFVEAV
jgi:transposase